MFSFQLFPQGFLLSKYRTLSFLFELVKIWSALLLYLTLPWVNRPDDFFHQPRSQGLLRFQDGVVSFVSGFSFASPSSSFATFSSLARWTGRALGDLDSLYRCLIDKVSVLAPKQVCQVWKSRVTCACFLFCCSWNSHCACFVGWYWLGKKFWKEKGVCKPDTVVNENNAAVEQYLRSMGGRHRQKYRQCQRERSSWKWLSFSPSNLMKFLTLDSGNDLSPH